MSLPTVLFLGPALLCVLAWLGVGGLVPRRALPDDRLLALLSRLVAGSLVFTLFVLALGRLHALLPAVVFGATVAAAVPGVVLAVDAVRSFSPPRSLGRLGWALAALVLAALVLDLVASTAPPTSADALVYHVEFPRRWLELHRIDDPFWNYASFYPLGIETLFAQAMAAVGITGPGSAMAAGSAASALHGILAVLAAAAVYGLARDLGRGSDVAGMLAVALFVLQGLVTWDSTSTFIDMGLAFYSAFAAWWAVRLTRRPRIAPAAWCGAGCGGALGAKYIGTLAAAFVLLVVATVALARRRPSLFATASAVALVTGGAWYLKNAIVTGNPFYPLLFGGKWWNAFAEGWVAGSAKYTFPGTHTFPLRILILPLDLVLHGSRFDRGQYASVVTLVLVPLALLAARRRELWLVFGVTAGFVAVWWYWVPQARYLLPALAVLAAVAGAGLERTLCSTGARRNLLVAVLAAGVLVWLASSAALTRQLVPVALGAEGRAHNVQRLLGTYDAMQQIRRRIGPALLGFAPSYRFVYWYPGPALTVDLPEFEYRQPRALFRSRLRAEGVRYMVFWGTVSQIPPLEGCAKWLDAYPGRYVTSRSRGTSVPLTFNLYSVAACR